MILITLFDGYKSFPREDRKRIFIINISIVFMILFGFTELILGDAHRILSHILWIVAFVFFLFMCLLYISFFLKKIILKIESKLLFWEEIWLFVTLLLLSFLSLQYCLFKEELLFIIIISISSIGIFTIYFLAREESLLSGETLLRALWKYLRKDMGALAWVGNMIVLIFMFIIAYYFWR